MITVRPVRFTEHAETAHRFFEALGLRVTITGDAGRWIDLRGAAGGIAIHPVEGAETGMPEGSTSLSFELSDPQGVLDRLAAAGRAEAAVWDESYGRVLGVDAPDGTRLWLDVEQDDLYGYHATGESFGGDLTACPIVFTADRAPWVGLLRDLGAEVDLDSPGYTQVVFPGTGGCVGIHEPRAGQTGDVVGAGFLTTAPLTEVASRLTHAGYEARVVDVEPPYVLVEDPTGGPVEIYSR